MTRQEKIIKVARFCAANDCGKRDMGYRYSPVRREAGE